MRTFDQKQEDEATSSLFAQEALLGRGGYTGNGHRPLTQF
jgi:hypothetical protein